MWDVPTSAATMFAGGPTTLTAKEYYAPNASIDEFAVGALGWIKLAGLTPQGKARK
jgi:hypothetical protein